MVDVQCSLNTAAPGVTSGGHSKATFGCGHHIFFNGFNAINFRVAALNPQTFAASTGVNAFKANVLDEALHLANITQLFLKHRIVLNIIISIL